MKRFRLRDHVPDVYVRQSRDFQLMCDLFDIVNNGVKFDIDTIIDTSDPLLCRESVLPYLQKKLGFEMDKPIPSDTLRRLLKSFRFVVKHKGSRRGIEEAICLFLNIIYINCNYTIEVINQQNNTNPIGPYVIKIELEENVLKNLYILDNILKYIIPAGYVLNYTLNYSLDDISLDATANDVINIILVNEQLGSKPRKVYNKNGDLVYNNPDDVSEYNQQLPGVIGAVGTTIVTKQGDPYYLNTLKREPDIYDENNAVKLQIVGDKESSYRTVGGFAEYQVKEEENNG